VFQNGSPAFNTIFHWNDPPSSATGMQFTPAGPDDGHLAGFPLMSCHIPTPPHIHHENQIRIPAHRRSRPLRGHS
jgi:hypothetical protein